jgi:hypothetical protein
MQLLSGIKLYLLIKYFYCMYFYLNYPLCKISQTQSFDYSKTVNTAYYGSISVFVSITPLISFLHVMLHHHKLCGSAEFFVGIN